MAEKQINVQHPQPSGKCKSKIKTTLRVHLTPVRIAKINKQKIITAHAGEDVWQGEQPSIADGSDYLQSQRGNQCGGSSRGWKIIYLNVRLYHSRHIPKRCSILPQRHLLNHVHCCSIHTSQKVETPRCPSAEEWIKKMQHLHNGVSLCH